MGSIIEVFAGHAALRAAPVTSPIRCSVDSRSARERGPVRFRPRWVRMAPRVRARAEFPLLFVDDGLMAFLAIRVVAAGL